MRYLLVLLMFTGCGGAYKVDGEVRVKHQIDLTTLSPYVEAFCQKQFADPQQISECVNAEFGNIIKHL